MKGMIMDSIAIHIITDMYKCNPESLGKSAFGEKVLREAISRSGLNAIHIESHQFQPSGYTAAAVLVESHISIHTWPELGTVLLDIFTCSEEKKAFAALEVLKKAFAPDKTEQKILRRGGRTAL